MLSGVLFFKDDSKGKAVLVTLIAWSNIVESDYFMVCGLFLKIDTKGTGTRYGNADSANAYAEDGLSGIRD